MYVDRTMKLNKTEKEKSAEDTSLVKVIKFRIYPSSTQIEKWNTWGDVTRKIFNIFLYDREQRYKWALTYYPKEEAGKLCRPFGFAHQSRELTQIKEINPEFAQIPSDVASAVLRQVEKSYSTVIQNRAQGKSSRSAYKRRDSDYSLTYMRSNGFRLEECSSHEKQMRVFGFPKCPEGIRVRYHKEIDGAVRGQIVKREGDKFFLCLIVESQRSKVAPKINKVVGIDLGVARTIQLSTGEHRDLPHERLNELDTKKRRFQKRLARTKNGSNQNKRLKERIRKLSAKIAAIRKYSLDMNATEIAKTYKGVVVEALKIKNMTKSAKGTVDEPGTNVKAKSGLNRSILGQAPYYFTSRLESKCKEFDRSFAKVDPKNTSRTCSSCGHVDKKSRKTQSKFQCTKCGHEMNADENAAVNIMKKAA